MAADLAEVASRVLAWYAERGDRSLPWRSARDPWAALVAAVMLRKTTARQAAKVYARFLDKYRDPRRVLEAGPAELEADLRPLGMHRVRARQLLELARAVLELGGVPCDRAALEALPGVGPYAASVVLLLACGEPEPLLDTNTSRLLSRLLALPPPRGSPYSDPALSSAARGLLGSAPGRALELNLGLLDLARLVCTARSPKCPECPLRGACASAASKGGQQGPRSSSRVRRNLPHQPSRAPA